MVLGQEGNSLVMMIAALVVLFCIFKFIYIAYFLGGLSRESYYQSIFDWFILPAEFPRIGERPWTVLTYMFMHDGVFHMLGNVLWLWAFGYILQDIAGNGKIVSLFFFGGLAGALLFVAANNAFPVLRADIAGRTLQGASAGVMAIAIATTTLAPNYRIFPMLNGGIPLWVLTVIFVIIDFASIPGENGGGHIAHIGGALIGGIFAWQLQKGRDWSAGPNRFFSWVSHLFDPDKKNWKKTARKEYHYKIGRSEPYRRVPNVTQKRIDEILDKINREGMKQLSEEEKEILKRAAEDEAP